MKREEIDNQWNEILEVIGSIEARKEHLVIIRDTTRHLGSMKPVNLEKVSYGGELIKTFWKQKSMSW